MPRTCVWTLGTGRGGNTTGRGDIIVGIWLFDHYGEGLRILAQDRDDWKKHEDSWTEAELKLLDKNTRET